jgi:hypothetical protein
MCSENAEVRQTVDTLGAHPWMMSSYGESEKERDRMPPPSLVVQVSVKLDSIHNSNAGQLLL